MKSIMDFGKAMTFVEPKLKEQESIMKQGLEATKRYGEGQQYMADNLYNVNQMFSTQKAIISSTGIAYANLANTLFWTGLGAMFATMSLMRAQRSELAVESATLSLSRAYVGAYKAQETYNLYLEAGITEGYEYTLALASVRESNLQVKYAQDQLTTSIINSNLSWLQLVYGTFPTLIRTTTELFNSVLLLAAAEGTETKTAMLAAAKTSGLIGVMGVGIPITNAFSISIGTLSLALGALFIAIPIITTILAMASAEQEAAKRTKDLEKELRSLGITITEPGSPPLYKVFGVIGDQINIVIVKDHVQINR